MNRLYSYAEITIITWVGLRMREKKARAWKTALDWDTVFVVVDLCYEKLKPKLIIDRRKPIRSYVTCVPMYYWWQLLIGNRYWLEHKNWQHCAGKELNWNPNSCSTHKKKLKQYRDIELTQVHALHVGCAICLFMAQETMNVRWVALLRWNAKENVYIEHKMDSKSNGKNITTQPEYFKKSSVLSWEFELFPEGTIKQQIGYRSNINRWPYSNSIRRAVKGEIIVNKVSEWPFIKNWKHTDAWAVALPNPVKYIQLTATSWSGIYPFK